MRKISEMYRRSGGTRWEHHCRECAWLKKTGKNIECAQYPEHIPWKENYIACKFYGEKGDSSGDGQLNIFDLMK